MTPQRNNTFALAFQNAKPEVKAVLRKIRATKINFGPAGIKNARSFKIISSTEAESTNGFNQLGTLVKEFVDVLKEFGSADIKKLMTIVEEICLQGEWVRLKTTKHCKNAERQSISDLLNAAGLEYADHPEWKWTSFSNINTNYTSINLGPGAQKPRFGGTVSKYHKLRLS